MECVHKILLITLWPIYIYFPFWISGNVEESLAEIQKVWQKKKYIHNFIEEGLWFSSSMHLLLIWMRVFQWILDKPDEVNKELSSNLPQKL